MIRYRRPVATASVDDLTFSLRLIFDRWFFVEPVVIYSRAAVSLMVLLSDLACKTSISRSVNPALHIIVVAFDISQNLPYLKRNRITETLDPRDERERQSNVHVPRRLVEVRRATRSTPFLGRWLIFDFLR